MDDYISREAAIKAAKCHYPKANEMIAGIVLVPAADVRPVAEISDAVYEAMYFLDSVSAQMPYHVYSALFDLILGILPTCGADMRELQTLKMQSRTQTPML